MAGNLFDNAAFRDGIHIAMKLGQSNVAPQVFHMPLVKDADGNTDGGGSPFDPDADVTTATPVTKTVLCAVEYQNADGTWTNINYDVAAQCRITFLYAEYLLIQGFEKVVMGASEYFYDHEAAPFALDATDVRIVYCKAKDTP